jgi:hypothetical protein
MIDRDCGPFLHMMTDEEALERKYVEGYQRKPESPSVGKLGEKMAQEVWQEEPWDEPS